MIIQTQEWEKIRDKFQGPDRTALVRALQGSQFKPGEGLELDMKKLPLMLARRLEVAIKEIREGVERVKEGGA